MLRSARPEDAHAIASVLVDSRKAFLPFAPLARKTEEVQGWVARHLVPEGGVTVATSGGKVVAVLAVSEDKDAAWIDQLYVLPGFENQGLGTDLLRHAHSTLRRPVRLYTFQQNAGARRFYERHGYKVVALSDGQSNEERCPDVLYELHPRTTEA
jgi:ribosomal protein S18 acetylase RimI-like enzyme